MFLNRTTLVKILSLPFISRVTPGKLPDLSCFNFFIGEMGKMVAHDSKIQKTPIIHFFLGNSYGDLNRGEVIYDLLKNCSETIYIFLLQKYQLFDYGIPLGVLYNIQYVYHFTLLKLEIF